MSIWKQSKFESAVLDCYIQHGREGGGEKRRHVGGRVLCVFMYICVVRQASVATCLAIDTGVGRLYSDSW